MTCCCWSGCCCASTHWPEGPQRRCSPPSTTSTSPVTWWAWTSPMMASATSSADGMDLSGDLASAYSRLERPIRRPWGVHEPGSNGVHAYLWAECVGKQPRHMVHGGLGDGIRDRRARRADARERRHVHDDRSSGVMMGGGVKVGGGGSGHVPGADDVHTEDLLPHLGGHVVELPMRDFDGCTGVVDEDVEASVAPRRCLDEGSEPRSGRRCRLSRTWRRPTPPPGLDLPRPISPSSARRWRRRC